MKNAWTMTKVRMRLALRNRAFIFFAVIFPMILLFTFLGFFARGRNGAVPYLLASVLALTVMGSFWGLSVQLVTFREQGILRRFRLTPVGAGAMLASSILSNYFMTLPTVVIEFVVARWLFHMTGWGNIGGVVVLVTLGMITFASLGLIVASVTNTMQETQMINQMLWWAFLLLGGATIPFPTLPNWLQHLALVLPATYLVVGLERVMVGGVGILELGPEILSLIVCTAIAFVVSQQIFRWEPEARVPRRAKLWAASTIIPFLLLGTWEIARGNMLANARADYQAMQDRVTINLIQK